MATFYDDVDRTLFLDLLSQEVEDGHLGVHAFALLPNHWHALATTPRQAWADGCRSCWECTRPPSTGVTNGPDTCGREPREDCPQFPVKPPHLQCKRLENVGSCAHKPTFSVIGRMSEPVLGRKQLERVGAGAFFRPRNLEGLGISFYALKQLARQGVVERVARGLYRLAEAEPTENYSLAAVSARVPNAIICLLSALRYHGIGTQLPREVWIAIPHKARIPKLPEFPIRIVRFSGPSLRHGVEEVRLEGVPARITSPARTVVDCFRFRRLVGKDAALEALREAVVEGKASHSQIWKAAEACRARSLVGPHLEMLAI